MKVIDYDNLIVSEKIFGIEIRDGLVKVLEVKRSRGKYSVVGYGKQEIETKAIENDIIIDQKGAAKAIKLARDQANPKKIKARYASVVLPDSKIFVRVVTFPGKMTKEDIRDAIQWKAKDLIAMPLDKVYWDWHRLTEGEEDEKIEVVVSAVEKECVDSYTRTLDLLNITPIYYDISGNAAARFLFQKEYKDKRALLVRIDQHTTSLSLFLDGGVRYQTLVKDLVKGGYNSLVDLAASKLEINKKEAEKLILSPEKLSEAQQETLREAFKVNYESLYQEIENILAYYSQNVQKSENGEVEERVFSGIYLYGKGARLFHLKEFLEKKELELDAKSGKKKVSPMLPFISKETLPENLVVLGLSLRNLGLFKELRDINLVPKKIKSKYLQVSIYSSLYTYLKFIFWGVYIIGILLIFAYVLTLFYRDSAEADLKSIENVAESPVNTELRESVSNLNNTGKKIELLTETQLDWDLFFEELSSSRPKGIQLNNVFVSEDPEAWKAISGEGRVVSKEGFIYMVIGGTANTRGDLQNYVVNLTNSDIFEDVKTPISSFESSQNLEFTVYGLVNTREL